MQIIHLSAPADLAQYRLAHNVPVILHYIGCHRIAFARRLGYNAHIPYAGHGHM